MRRAIVVLVGAVTVGACERGPVPATAPEWKLEEVAAFTGTDASGGFRAITSLALHADGRLAVVDTSVKRVLVYRVGGTSSTPAGSFGAGDGQYRSAVSAAWLSDTLAVYDPELSRIMFFGTGLTPIANTFALKLPGPAHRFYPVSGAKAYLRSIAQSGSVFRPVLIGFTGRTAGDTAIIADAPAVATGSLCSEPNGVRRFFEWPEAAIEYVAPVNAAGSMAHVRAADYRVAIRSPAGDTSARFTRAFDRVALPVAAWDSAMTGYAAYIAEHGTANCYPAPVRTNARIPVRAVALSTDGDLWITRLTKTGVAFDVISAQGAQRAILHAPPHVTSVPIAIADGYVALVTREATGGEVARVYRIVR